MAEARRPCDVDPVAELARFRIGADENGLGPRLGPLIVTAVLAEVTEEGHRQVGRAPRGKLAELLGDSKVLLAHGDIALGEAWARCLVERGAGSSRHGATTADLVRAFSIDPSDVLTRHCPEHAKAQCWTSEGETFVADPGVMRAIHKALDTLELRGIRILSVRSGIVCTDALNRAARAGKSRFHVDLHTMEKLILSMRGEVDGDLLAVCGKVGGIGHYQSAFGPLGGRLSTMLVEKRHESAYFFPGLGELRFLVDADASDRLVGLSSLVGKWLREVLMGRITRHYRQHDETLPDASGYHDPITEQFVRATRLVRKKRSHPDDCFERVSLGALQAESS